MTYLDAVTTLTTYQNQQGFVVPDVGDDNSGNEIAYTVLAALLLNALYPEKQQATAVWLMDRISKCEVESGLYARTPDKKYGEETWDDYLMLAVAFKVFGRVFAARRVYERARKEAFFVVLFRPVTWKDFMGRFPQVWLMFAWASGESVAGGLAWIASWFIKANDWKSWAYFQATGVRTHSVPLYAICSDYFKDPQHAITRLAYILEHGET